MDVDVAVAGVLIHSHPENLVVVGCPVCDVRVFVAV